MKLKIGNIEIEADTVEAMRELLAMANVAAPASKPSVTITQGGKGPYETQYNELTGKQLRLSVEERADIESGRSTREDFAKARIDNLSTLTNAITDEGSDIL